MAEWIAQVTWNEKGFWQGDLFHGEFAYEPEAFFTLKRGQTSDDAVAKAKEKWPLAEVRLFDGVGDDDCEYPDAECTCGGVHFMEN